MPHAVRERNFSMDLKKRCQAAVDPRRVNTCATDLTPVNEPFGGPGSDAGEMQRTGIVDSQVAGGIDITSAPARVNHDRRARFYRTVPGLITLKVGDRQAVARVISRPVPHVDQRERADQTLGRDLVDGSCVRREVRGSIDMCARMLAERYNSTERAVFALRLRDVEDRWRAARPHDRVWPQSLRQVDDEHWQSGARCPSGLGSHSPFNPCVRYFPRTAYRWSSKNG